MTPKEYAIKALPLIQAMAEGKTIQLKLENGEWEARINETGRFEFDKVEYRVAPDDPMDAWRERLFETFIRHVTNERRVGVAVRFNEVFAQRPPQKFLMRPHEAKELRLLARDCAVAEHARARAFSSGSDLQMREADEACDRLLEKLHAWIEERTCD